MFLNAIYTVLQAISYGVYTFVAAIWHIEETMINIMMSTFLFVLSMACHPIMIIPMILFGVYAVRNFWSRRAKNPKVDGSDSGFMAGIRSTPRTPRIPSYRSFAGNLAKSGGDGGGDLSERVAAQNLD